ncbi:hypothetical protein GQ457_13G009160 [Hibiscus cannabinus]
MSASPDCDIVGRWGESLDDFSEDEENIVPITEVDDVHLLDVDDVEVVMADASEENGLDVEDDVWNAAVARLGSGNTQPVWGYVGPQSEQSVPNYTAYEPPTSMYDVDYTAMRDREHEARIFGSSSSSSYGELVLNAQFETKKEAQMAVKEYCIKRHMSSSVVESNTQTYCVRCVNWKNKCPWWVRISYKKMSQMWEVTRFKENHTCSNMDQMMVALPPNPTK